MEITVGKSTVLKVQRLWFVGNRPILRERHLIQCGWLKKNSLGPWIWWNLPGWSVVKLDTIQIQRFNNHGWSTNIPTPPARSPPQGNQWFFSARKTSHEAPSPNNHNQSSYQLKDVEECGNAMNDMKYMNRHRGMRHLFRFARKHNFKKLLNLDDIGFVV